VKFNKPKMLTGLDQKRWVIGCSFAWYGHKDKKITGEKAGSNLFM
jgi:hypothetical protein